MSIPKHDLDAALTALALVEASLDRDLERAKMLIDSGQDGSAILNYLVLFVDRLARSANPKNPKLITEALRAAFLAAELDGDGEN
ncbi:hypothetical protein [Mycolicibacterium psychrotolerans]|uniref:Uncharacterized protein n=1 Tax=Mycolicibacterium psychrotolerans TaxID=216929 RepID=A0A7I7MCR9_9MYCO|nr:hypothetical protein [Mycolicibacterium psychrotolerans]BBX69587.1 hypothetical protein MPSYJ_30480 [Mycolicibacterium psychrotolerans]